MEKITKSQVKLIRSLQQKKYRDELGLFVAEGEKCVSELAKAFEPIWMVIDSALPYADNITGSHTTLCASATEIARMSSLRTPQGIIGVFRKPQYAPPSLREGQEESLSLALDGIQDPGNLGTIIRTCDWFGVHNIYCSEDTADCYNPKVVQATMGALARVRLYYLNLPQWLLTINNKKINDQMVHDQMVNIFGTLLDGKDLYEVLQSEGRSQSEAVTRQSALTEKRAVIIMGNEGNGISPEVRKLVTHPVRIPSYPKNAETSESLNVAIATAVTLAAFRQGT